MIQGIRRPILVGGLGLTAGAWLLGWMSPMAANLSEGMLWTAILMGSGWWWLKKPQRSPLDLSLPPQPLDRSGVERAIATAAAGLQQLATEGQPNSSDSNATANAITVNPDTLATLQTQLATLQASLQREQVAIALLGGAATGKTSVAQFLSQHWLPQSPQAQAVQSITELPGNWAAAGDSLANSSSEILNQADLTIFVVNGDLTDTDLAALTQLQQQHHRLLLAFSKQDQYLPDEQPLIVQQLRERVLGIVPAPDVVAIAPQPAPIKVRQHQADGTMQERMEQPAPTVEALTQRLEAALATERPALVLATTQRQTEQLTQTIRATLNQLRRDRALVPIEQAQWIAATAAFASPVPSLDLLATASVNAQLVMDLGTLYQQPLSLDQAKTIVTTLAETMMKLGFVELTSQAIAPILKSHTLTFAVGGMVQGISAAYLTRMAGLSLIEYFQAQDPRSDTGFSLKPERLSQILQTVFQANQRSAFLQSLVNQGFQRLKPLGQERMAIATPKMHP